MVTLAIGLYPWNMLSRNLCTPIRILPQLSPSVARMDANPLRLLDHPPKSHTHSMSLCLHAFVVYPLSHEAVVPEQKSFCSLSQPLSRV